MRVIKRNGKIEDVSFDKITQRLRVIQKEQGLEHLDIIPVVQSVVSYIHDNISTQEIDNITARILMSMSSTVYDYQRLASVIVVSNLHKRTLKKFSKKARLLYKNGLLSKKVYNFAINNADQIDNLIDYDRDYLLDFFGFKTLERGYLQRINGEVTECPQDIFMRVSIALWCDTGFSAIADSYNMLSRKFFSHATPTLFNVGTMREQAASCFLLHCGDSIDSMYKTISDCAKISKWAGGIGVNISDIRASDSRINGTNGKTSGIIPMLRVFNNTALHVNQGGKRPGSFAFYLEPHHPDILDFLDVRKNHGDESRRARDIFTAVWLNDLFMERIKNNEAWSLLNPQDCHGLTEVYGKEYKKLYEQYESEGKFMSQMPARDLWKAIITSQIETGTPYLLNKDSVNEMSNQKNIGVVKGSNLCVAPETMILTDNGYQQIKDLQDQSVNVWNGQEYSEIIVRKTAEHAHLIKVEMSNGSTLECTPEHQFYIATGKRPSEHPKIQRVSAKDLVPDMKLIHSNFPIITKGSDEFPYPYEHGLFCADGTYEGLKLDVPYKCDFKHKENSIFCGRHQHHYDNHSVPTDNKCCAMIGEGSPRITLYGEKKKLKENIHYRDDIPEPMENPNTKTITCRLPLELYPKFTVPINYNLDIKLRWLEGVLDGDGCACYSDDTTAIQITSVHNDFLTNMKYLLQTLGCDPKICNGVQKASRRLPNGKGGHDMYDCNQTYRLLINSHDVALLYSLGFSPKRLKITGIFPRKQTKHYIKVISVKDIGRISDTFCFTEQKRGMGIFNGIITGQCAEITEFTSPEEHAVCTLASICLPMCVENGTFNYNKLREVAHQVTRNLNKLIDINFYPVPETETSNKRHRPLGIGIQGLADVYLSLGFAYDSPEAAEINKKISETLYFSALEASADIAEIEGTYSTFDRSDLSKGIFHFERFAERTGKPVELSGLWDFESLRERILSVGVRNSLLIALMPTASTSQIMGNTESFEPITANIYTRKTLAGDFIVINKFLVRELEALGLYNESLKNKIIASDGSVQSILEIPEDVRKKYKTVWELKQKVLIDQSAARTPFVCQSQSLNLYFKNPTFSIIHSAMTYAHQCSLKTMIYYTRTLAVGSSTQFTVAKAATVPSEQNDPANCESCSG